MTTRRASGHPVTQSPRHPVTRPTVVIGYGNELRGDDAAGPLVAEAVAGWDLPGVTAVALRQLVPELAETIARARRVVFVDACAGGQAGRARIRPVEPGGPLAALGHTGDPAALLALAAALYGACPPAWLITVPAASFALGAGLSAPAARGVDEALRQIRRIVAHPCD